MTGLERLSRGLRPQAVDFGPQRQESLEDKPAPNQRVNFIRATTLQQFLLVLPFMPSIQAKAERGHGGAAF